MSQAARAFLSEVGTGSREENATNRSFRFHALAAFALAMVLGGCSDIYFDRRDTVSLGAGDAVAANIATQTVDFWPRAAGERNIVSDGQKMQSAVERYRTNKVTPPAGIGTSSVGYQQPPSASAAPAVTH
jgi:hypothetical protein